MFKWRHTYENGAGPLSARTYPTRITALAAGYLAAYRVKGENIASVALKKIVEPIHSDEEEDFLDFDEADKYN